MPTILTTLPARTRSRLVLALSIGLAVQSGTASALEVTRSRVVAAPPAAVWSLIGGFCDIAHWHPQVTRCTLSSEGGAPVRALVAAGGLGTLVEVETARDEAAFRYSYRLISGPLPVKGYVSTLSVAPVGGNPATSRVATITWTATFEAKGMSEAEAVADVAGVYEAGLAAIAGEVAP